MGLSSSFLHFVLWLSLFHLTLSHSTSSKQSLCHDEERSALLQFKESLIINMSSSTDSSAYPKVASWKAEEANGDCCSWDGITCHGVTGHVIKLDLTSCYLYGSINSSSSLFHLAHLERLSLADNHFNGSKIPSGIRNFSRLSHLNLSISHFSGQIPSEILELSELEFLDVSYNLNLELQKPGLRSLAEKLTKLKKLYLSRVNISSSVPHILANLSSLNQLGLRECQLQGEFPIQIFQLPNLSVLSVHHNPDLTGYLPEFETTNPLEVLRLAGTRFSGEIPDSIGNIKSLSYLDISNCDFSGTIPSSIGYLGSLQALYLFSNDFWGELPATIGNLHSLEELDIYDCRFLGQLPSSLGNLTQLKHLVIGFNDFPDLNSYSLSWISKLTKLVYLDLSGLNIVGGIPPFLNNLTQLTTLFLNSNQLTGSIPFWLTNLNRLHILDLSDNQLQGSISNFIIELKNPQHLYLDSNNFNGTVDLDTILVKKKSLEVLVLSSNKLSVVTKNNVNNTYQKFHTIGLGSCNLSKFPNFLHRQDELRVLDLSSNNISGEIPRWLLNVSIDSLLSLNLSHNLLIGFQQQSFLQWNSLLSLDLRYNKLQGSIPIPPLSTMQYLVSNNKFTGKISQRICSLNHLRILDLSDNLLSGILPQCLGNFSYNLAVLELQNNKFYGSIPQNFMNGTNLRMIDLSGNLLEGKIPRSLANCTRLQFLDLGNNQITGIFPSWLGTLPELQVLILQSNRFYGIIKDPKKDCEFPKLRIIDLSHNEFTGELPSNHFQCWNAMKNINTSHLTYMQDDHLVLDQDYLTFSYAYFFDYVYTLTMSNKGIQITYEKISTMLVGILLSGNKFIGEIPTSIANLKGIQNLNLSKNNLFGQIPSTLQDLAALESLDLSYNKLSGQIPQQLTKLTTLEYFTVAHNLLTGPIPQGKQFDTFSDSSFDGNPGLCGRYISRKCSSDAEAPQEDDRGSRPPSAFDWKIALIGYAGGTIIGVVLGHTFTTRKHGWFAMICERQLKITVRNRRHRR